jgi:hypothetical protein
LPLSPRLRFLPAFASLAKLAIDFIRFCAAKLLRSDSCSLFFLRSLILAITSWKHQSDARQGTFSYEVREDWNAKRTICFVLCSSNHACGSVLLASSSFLLSSSSTNRSRSFSAFARILASYPAFISR